jgi:GNAT superfamily N-acetyltransferase
MQLPPHLEIKRVTVNDPLWMNQIGDWYYDEWGIENAESVDELKEMPATGVPFQIVVLEKGVPIATGGIRDRVGLIKQKPEMAKYGPWVALLYTVPNLRGQGIGAILCEAIEEIARESGMKQLHLYTKSAETLYLRQGYQPIERLFYRNASWVILEKNI